MMAKDRASRATIWRTVAGGIRTGIPVLLTAGLMLMALAAAGQVVIPTINVSTVPLPTGLYQMTTSSGSAGSPPVSVAVIWGSDRSVQVICLEACAWAQPEAFGWAVASDITADPSRTTVAGLNGKVNAGQFKGTVSAARNGGGGALPSVTVTLTPVPNQPSLPPGNYVLIYDVLPAAVAGYTLGYANAMVIKQVTGPSLEMNILQPPGFLPNAVVMPFLYAPRSGNLIFIGHLTPSPASSGTEQPHRIAGVTADGQLLGMDLHSGTATTGLASVRGNAYWRASFVAGSGKFTLPAGGYAFSGDNLLGVTAAVRALPNQMLGVTFAGAPELYCNVNRNHIDAGGSGGYPLLSGVLLGDGQLVTSFERNNIFTGGAGAGQGMEPEVGLIHPQTATNSLPDGLYQLADFDPTGTGAWTKGATLAVTLKNSGGHVTINGQDKTMSAAWDCSLSNNLLQCLQGGDVTHADFIGVLTGLGQAVGSHFTSKADTTGLSGLKKAELKWISATPATTTASPAAGLSQTPVTQLQNPPASTSSGVPTQTPVTQLQNPPASTSSGVPTQTPVAKLFPDCANTFAFKQGMLWTVTYLGKTDTWTVHDVPHPEYPDSGNFVDLKGNTFTYQIDCNGVDLTGEPGGVHLPGTLSADHKTATLACPDGDTKCVDQFGKIIKVTIQ